MWPIGRMVGMAVACHILVSAAAHAAGVGTTGASFLKVGVGGRALSMAGAGVASSQDAHAVYWNPAGLIGQQKRNIAVSYNSLFQDQSQGFIAYASPLSEKKGDAFGVGFNYLQVGKIEKRQEDTESADSTFTNQNYAVSLSYARSLPAVEKLSLGGTIKYVRTALDTFTGNTVAFDVGASHQTTDKLSTALSIQNFGGKIGPDHLPLVTRLGAAYAPWDKKLTLAVQGDFWIRDERNYFSLGTEYWIAPQLAARVGYQFGHSEDKLGGTAGLGAGLGFRVSPIDVDYAFVPFGDLGYTHRVSLVGRF